MKHKGVSFLLDYPGEAVLSDSYSREMEKAPLTTVAGTVAVTDPVPFKSFVPVHFFKAEQPSEDALGDG
ncbi:MAG: hypothetical protein OEY51_09320 [Cyclobacteriaceae bacterium]|nr:hypothetical protein [Cyclobacteriaceae bacterium]